MIFPYRGVFPRIGKDVFIAPTAVIVGNVIVESSSSIWFNAVVRGDMEPIKIGSNSNIQDNCVIHTDHDFPVNIGNNVTIGHNAVIHGCSIDNNVLVGMGAVILNGASIGSFSIVAAGSIVLEKQFVNPYTLIAGIPAVSKKKLDDSINSSIDRSYQDYLDLSQYYINDKNNF